METIKSGKQVFLVVGVMNTGSGSLTWPEDFHMEGVFDNQEDAQEFCDELNSDNVGVDDEFEYTVEDLNVLLKKR